MRNLILLQGNTRQVAFINSISNTTVKNIVKGFIDKVAETFESIKTSLQMAGHYDSIINLTDVRCTKNNLLSELIRQSKDGNMFDLLILGHGNNKQLMLHDNEVLTDVHVKAMLTQARKLHPGMKFNLRLVYMCNCYGGTMSDAWLSIGAKTSIGCNNVNYMPEPQTTHFFDDFVKKGYSVVDACNRSFDVSNAWWKVTGLPEKDRRGSKLTVKGENIRFEGRRMTVGEVLQRNIYASNTHNYTSIYLMNGEKYEFKVTGSQKWKNGVRETTANGYPKGPFDFPRQKDYNVMTLVGEIFNDSNNVLSFTGTHFKIGTAKTWTATKSGFLVCHANDGLPFYADNSGKMSISIKRIS